MSLAPLFCSNGLKKYDVTCHYIDILATSLINPFFLLACGACSFAMMLKFIILLSLLKYFGFNLQDGILQIGQVTKFHKATNISGKPLNSITS